MSTVTDAVVPCPAIQAPLNDFFETCDLGRFDSPVLSFLYSPENTTGIRQTVNPGGGKLRTVNLTYTQVVPESEVDDVASCELNCTATTERGDLVKQYTIDCTDGIEVEGLYDRMQWNESCTSDCVAVFNIIKNMLGGLMNKLARQVVTDLNPLIGSWADGSGTLDVDGFLEVETTKATSGDLQPRAFQTIANAKMLTGYCMPDFIAGGLDLYGYYQLMRAGCCTNDGLNALEILNQLGEVVTFDRFVMEVYGNDTSLMFGLRAVQLLTYNSVVPSLADCNLGFADLNLSYRNYWEGIILDPRTGIPVDVRIKDDCGKVHIVMRVTAKPVGLPIDMVPEGHALEGVTFLNGITVNNPA